MNRMTNVLLAVVLMTVALVPLASFDVGPSIQVEAASVTPDDNVNGSYVQVLNGNWYVSGPVTLSDEVIELNGNLVLKPGSHLTLNHVELRLNVTTDAQYGIVVGKNAKLEVWDKDGHAGSWGDESIITDTIYDVDDHSSSDHSYTFDMDKTSELVVHNSIIENGGKWNGVSCSFRLRHNVVIENSTIQHMGRIEINQQSPEIERLRLVNVTIEDCSEEVFIELSDSIDEDWDGDITINDVSVKDTRNFALQAGGDITTHRISLDNSSVRYYDLQKVRVYGLEAKDYPSGGYRCFSVQYCDDVRLYSCNISNAYEAIYIYGTDVVEMVDVTVSGATHSAEMRYAEQAYLEDVRIYDVHGASHAFQFWNNDHMEMVDCYAEKGFYGYFFYTCPDVRLENVHAQNQSSGTGANFQDCDNARVYNSTFLDVNRIAYSGDGSNVTLINCTQGDDSKYSVSYSPGFSPPYNRLYIGNWAEVTVTDVMGAVPRAQITAVNGSGGGPVAYTLADGKVLMPVLNRTLTRESDNTFINHSHGPYSFSSDIGGQVTTDAGPYDMLSNVQIALNYLVDTPPATCSDLRLIREHDDLTIDFEVLSSDFDHYQVYKNTTSGFAMVYDSSLDAPNMTRTSWTDMGAAGNQSIYRYYVVVWDTAGSTSYNSEIVENGDWAVTGARTFISTSFWLNGSLEVAPGGILVLKDVDLYTNVTRLQDRNAIEVTGGAMVVTDLDENPSTSADASTILPMNGGMAHTITVLDGSLDIRNSQLQGLGYKTFIDFMNWGLDDDDNRSVHYEVDGTMAGFQVYGGDLILGNLTHRSMTTVIYANGADEIHLENVHFFATKDNILHIEETRLVTLDGCHMNDTRYNGLLARAVDQMYIVDTKVNQSGHHCVSIEESGYINVTNSRFENGTRSTDNLDFGACLSIAAANEVDVKGNYIANYTMSGSSLVVKPYGRAEISDNHFFSSGGALYLCYPGAGELMLPTFGFAPRTIKNNIYDSMIKNGIDIKSMTNLTLLNEDIRSPIQNCIMMFVADVYMENCSFESYAMPMMSFATLASDIIAVNSTFEGLLVGLGGTVTLRNCEYVESEVEHYFDMGTILIQNYINVTVKDPNGIPLAGALLNVESYNSHDTFSGRTGADGVARYVVVDERKWLYNTNVTEMPTRFTASFDNHHTDVFRSSTPFGMVNVTLDNEKPIVVHGHISPGVASTLNDLELYYEIEDVDGDLIDNVTIKWYTNGVHNVTHDNDTIIPSSMTMKNQLWYASIMADDGYGYGELLNTSWVMVQNVAPVITNVSVGNDSFRSDEDITVNYTFYDLDGDEDLGTTIMWQRFQDAQWTTIVTSLDPVLPSTYTLKHDQWRALVAPYDGEDMGMPKFSQVFEITNSPPKVECAMIIPDKPTSSDDLVVDHETYDIDQDGLISVGIVWYVDNGTGFVPTDNTNEVLPAEFTMRGEYWKCRLTPTDGEGSNATGGWFWTEPVYINNSLPYAENLTIAPAAPTSADDLLLVYDFIDVDCDAETGTMIEWWYKKEGDQDFGPSGMMSAKVPSSWTKEGQSWYARIRASDQFGASEWKVSPTIEIQNSAPIITSLKVLPEEPITTSNLTISYSAYDPDGDPIDTIETRWTRDGLPMSEHDDQPYIPSEQTSKGEVWRCKVRLGNEGTMSDWVMSSPIVVLDSSPKVHKVLIESYLNDQHSGSKKFYTNHDLCLNYSSTDLDSDVVNVDVVWYRNGLRQPSLNDDCLVPSTETVRDDIWYAVVEPEAGGSVGNSMTTPLVRILNTAPSVVSTSPSSPSVQMKEGETMEFSIDCVDPDKEVLYYRWYLNSDTVSESHRFTFAPDHVSAGTYVLNATSQDGTGARTFHLWSIIVNDVNRPPNADITEPVEMNPVINENSNIRFAASYWDPDEEDTLSLKWYLDDVEVYADEDSYTYYPDYNAAGSHVITFEVSDGENTTRVSRNVTVKNVDPDEGKILGLYLDTWGIILEAFALGGSVLIATFAAVKFRMRKTKLKGYIKRIKEIEKTHKDDVHARETTLLELRAELTKLYADGKIEDNHYLIIEKKIDDGISRARKKALDEDLEWEMSLSLKKEIDSVLKDGVVSDPEFGKVKLMIMRDKELTPKEKRELIGNLNKWRKADAEVAKEAPAPSETPVEPGPPQQN